MSERRPFPRCGTTPLRWCIPFLALVCFTLPQGAWAQQTTLTAHSVTETGAGLTINKGGTWHYKQTAPNDGTCATSTNHQTVSLSGLEPDTSYTYEAFNDANCTSPNIADETFTTVDFALVSKTATTATLKLEHYPANWWYNETSQNVKGCTQGQSGEFTVTGLTKETSYSFQAYRASGLLKQRMDRRGRHENPAAGNAHRGADQAEQRHADPRQPFRLVVLQGDIAQHGGHLHRRVQRPNRRPV